MVYEPWLKAWTVTDKCRSGAGISGDQGTPVWTVTSVRCRLPSAEEVDLGPDIALHYCQGVERDRLTTWGRLEAERTEPGIL